MIKPTINVKESFNINDFGMYYSSIYNEGLYTCGIDACSWHNDCAMFTGNKYKNVMTVNRVSVHPKLRGKGIAKLLLSNLCDLAYKNNIVLELAVSPDLTCNSLDYDRLVNLYEKFNFKSEEDLSSIMVRLPNIL